MDKKERFNKAYNFLKYEGVIKKHKMGRRNLYSKKEVMDIFSSEMESAGKGII
jgi:hypothetical protein